MLGFGHFPERKTCFIRLLLVCAQWKHENSVTLYEKYKMENSPVYFYLVFFKKKQFSSLIDWYFIYVMFPFIFSMFHLCPSAETMFLLGYEMTVGTLLFKKKKKKDFLRKHESLLSEFVWLNLSSFKDVMAGCIANLCWRNCVIISEPWLGTFDLFFPLFCPLSQHVDNTLAAVVLKMMQSSHAAQDSLFSSCFLSGSWQLWAFVCVTYRNKGGFGRKAASLGRSWYD